MWPVSSSTIVMTWVKPPRTGHGNFCGSKEILSPGCCAGGVVDGNRIAAGLGFGQCGHCPRILRIKMMSAEVRSLYGCLPWDSS